MNGAESLVRTLVESGVDTCFANPGTSEMHFVAALDKVPGIRPVLALFEGVVTGAADGYGRMAGKPAATLLERGLAAAGRISAKTGARLLCDTFAPRLQRGADRVAVERIPYFAEQTVEFLKETDRDARTSLQWIFHSSGVVTPLP